MDAEETIFIAYREDLTAFYNKWEKVFEIVGWLNVPTSVANSIIPIEQEVKMLNYKIKCEKGK